MESTESLRLILVPQILESSLVFLSSSGTEEATWDSSPTGGFLSGGRYARWHAQTSCLCLPFVRPELEAYYTSYIM